MVGTNSSYFIGNAYICDRSDKCFVPRYTFAPDKPETTQFRYTIVQQFSRGDERIGEDIPVPDSFGTEAFLVGIFTTVAVGI